MRQLLTAIACIILTTLAFAQDDLLPSLGVVLDLERPSEADVLFLRNGDQLTGTILNDSFSIRTSYAQLSFNNRAVAGIDLEGGTNNIESIVTVNDNRFSGFIDDPFFAFRLQGGPLIEVRREKVLKAIFRLREQEREGIPQRQFVTMKNGDYFSGSLLNTNLVAATTYAEVPLDLTSVESITFIGQFNPLTRVVYHNGDTLQGILNQEDMRFLLDVGGEVEIYQDRIDSVFLREGFVPVASADSATTGVLRISGTPTGARVTIEDRPVGELGPVELRLPVGPITISLSADGYMAEERTVVVAQDDTTHVEVALSPRPRNVEQPSPDTAQVQSGLWRSADRYGSILLDWMEAGGMKVRELSVPGTFAGSISDEDLLPNGDLGLVFSLKGLIEGTTVVIEMLDPARTWDLDTYLYLYDVDAGAVIADNDDAPDTNRSELVFRVEPGISYAVVASSWAGSDTADVVLNATIR